MAVQNWIYFSKALQEKNNTLKRPPSPQNGCALFTRLVITMWFPSITLMLPPRRTGGARRFTRPFTTNSGFGPAITASFTLMPSRYLRRPGRRVGGAAGQRQRLAATREKKIICIYIAKYRTASKWLAGQCSPFEVSPAPVQ